MGDVDDDRAEIEEMLSEAQQDLNAEQADLDSHGTGIVGAFSRFKNWCASHKKRSVLLVVLLVLVVLAVIPYTRYSLAGLVIRHGVEVQVLDSQTNQPVSGADVSLRGTTVKTNSSGKARFERVRSGITQLGITKKYYQDSQTNITIGFKETTLQTYALTATGRQIPVRVTNKITGEPVEGVSIVAASADAQTDKDGETNIVVDASVTTLEAELTATGYNSQRVNLTAGQEVSANTFALTPAGKVYFLSKKTGKIDVVKTDLDGANRQTVLEGTGNEETTSTVMLASRDWKFLALLARRDGARAVLYLIDTSSDKLTQIDSNNAEFSLAGWSGHNFVYSSRSNAVLDWQPGQSQLKTFNAETGQLTKIDETAASGTNYVDYVAESIGSVYLLDDSVVYAKNWLGDSVQTAGKRPALYAAKSNGNDKKLVKDFDSSYLTIVQSEPRELYVQQSGVEGKTTYYTYENAVLKQDDTLTSQSFNQFYATYLLSPSSNKTFWYEPRDGKNSLFVGDKNGQSGREILSIGEYVTYGWYGDAYVLVSKNGSELYIASSGQVIDESALQKVTDYHKPSLSYPGYGGGYGGL